MSSNNPDEFYNVETKNIHYSAVDPLHAPVLLEKVERGRTEEDAADAAKRSSLTLPDQLGTPVGRVGTPGKMNSPTSPTFAGAGGSGDTAAQRVRDGMQGAQTRIMAGSERFMRGFRRGEGSGSTGSGGSGGSTG